MNGKSETVEVCYMIENFEESNQLYFFLDNGLFEASSCVCDVDALYFEHYYEEHGGKCLELQVCLFEDSVYKPVGIIRVTVAAKE